MHRLLLADDDTIVRMYLSDVVDWEKHGLQVVGAARDGEEALEMVHTLQPDVILADISMPRLDGIGLLSRLRGESYEGVITMLSCHDDFDLVKAAMQQGADDYLLKNHLNDTNIGEIADKLRSLAEKRQKQYHRDGEVELLLRKGRRVVRRELLQGILQGNLQGERLEQQMRSAGLRGKYRQVLVQILQLPGAEPEQMDAFLSLCEQRLEKENAEILRFREDSAVLLLDLSEEPSMQKAMEKSSRLGGILQKLALQYLNLETSAAASGVCSGESALTEALRQADLLIGRGFYGPGSWKYGVDALPADSVPDAAAQLIRELPELMENASDSQIDEKWTEALEEIQKAGTGRIPVDAWLRDCDAAAGCQRSEEEYRSLLFWADYADAAKAWLQVRQEQLGARVPEGASAAIRSAVLYIYDHFSEPLSLSVVSGEVNLSMTYFSTLFKQEVGKGFAEFLTEVRLEWVRRRITGTNQTLKQISVDAGFQDYPYFCKTFKKACGLSPAEYRKRNSK